VWAERRLLSLGLHKVTTGIERVNTIPLKRKFYPDLSCVYIAVLKIFSWLLRQSVTLIIRNMAELY
jgi:hypothetical protein